MCEPLSNTQLHQLLNEFAREAMQENVFEQGYSEPDPLGLRLISMQRLLAVLHGHFTRIEVFPAVTVEWINT